jgi:hypothetical protein
MTGSVSGGVPGLDAVCFNGAGLSFFLLPVEPVVLLRVSLVGISEMVSCGAGGFLACAIANGPANLGRKGAAIVPAIKLARTVTGNTFSFNRSFFFDSPPPNTMFCMRL